MSEVVRKLTEAAATAMGTVVSAEVAEMLREQQAAAKDREARYVGRVERPSARIETREGFCGISSGRIWSGNLICGQGSGL